MCEVQQLVASGKCYDAHDTMQLMGAAFRQLDASCMAVGSTDMVPAKFKCVEVSVITTLELASTREAGVAHILQHIPFSAADLLRAGCHND